MQKQVSVTRLRHALQVLGLRAKFDRANEALVLRFPRHVALFVLEDEVLRARAMWLGGVRQVGDVPQLLEFADDWNRAEALPKCTFDDGGNVDSAPELTWEQPLLLEGGASDAQLEDFLWTFLNRVTLGVTRAGERFPQLIPEGDDVSVVPGGEGDD